MIFYNRRDEVELSLSDENWQTELQSRIDKWKTNLNNLSKRKKRLSNHRESIAQLQQDIINHHTNNNNNNNNTTMNDNSTTIHKNSEGDSGTTEKGTHRKKPSISRFDKTERKSTKIKSPRVRSRENSIDVSGYNPVINNINVYNNFNHTDSNLVNTSKQQQIIVSNSNTTVVEGLSLDGITIELEDTRDTPSTPKQTTHPGSNSNSIDDMGGHITSNDTIDYATRGDNNPSVEGKPLEDMQGVSINDTS